MAIPVKLTPNFSMAELLARSGASELPPALLPDATDHARMLERVRELVGGKRIFFDEGGWYRTTARNAEVGGVVGSAHLRARGSDNEVEGLTPRQVMRILASKGSHALKSAGVDVAIEYPGHVHLSSSASSARAIMLLHTDAGDVPWTDDRIGAAPEPRAPSVSSLVWWLVAAAAVLLLLRAFGVGS